MDKVFDNGCKVLGTIGSVKKYIQNNCDNIEEVKELLEDLSQYTEDIFVVVDYDNGMGYYIEYFPKDSEVEQFMRIVETKIYEFKELDNEIQNKLIDDEIEHERDVYVTYCLEDDMLDKASELITDCFGKCANIKAYYDLTYCQGSGAMIEFDVDMVDINKALRGNLTDDEIKLLNDYEVVVSVRHNNGHYYHERSFVYDYSIEYEYSDDYIDGLSEKLDVLMDNFYDCVVDINCKLGKYGYSLIEDYCTDRDYFIEKLSENEYYEDGEVYCEYE